MFYHPMSLEYHSINCSLSFMHLQFLPSPLVSPTPSPNGFIVFLMSNNNQYFSDLCLQNSWRRNYIAASNFLSFIYSFIQAIFFLPLYFSQMIFINLTNTLLIAQFRCAFKILIPLGFSLAHSPWLSFYSPLLASPIVLALSFMGSCLGFSPISLFHYLHIFSP